MVVKVRDVYELTLRHAVSSSFVDGCLLVCPIRKCLCGSRSTQELCIVGEEWYAFGEQKTLRLSMVHDSIVKDDIIYRYYYLQCGGHAYDGLLLENM